MPAKHFVDYEKKIITTSWEGEVSDAALSEAFQHYHSFLLKEPVLFNYDEILNFTNVDLQSVTSQGLIQLTQIAYNIDRDRTQVTRTAIVVNSILAFGMARMYEIYRNLNSKNIKKLRVFRNVEEAMTWIDRTESLIT